MPLPTNSTAFPGTPWDSAYRVYAENDAWYTGNTDALRAIYAQDERIRPTHQRRGQTMQGGFIGSLTRMFWGRQVPDGENRTRLHIPAPADIAMLSSDLLFSEPPTTRLTETNERAQARLDLIANSPTAHSMLSQAGELSAAFGAVVLTTTWDTQTMDHAWIKESAADVTIPEFRNGKLIAVTLWTQYHENSQVYRHLERHEIGAIFHGLYLGTENNLGRVIPLTERNETAHYADLVNSEGAILTGLDRLTASYMVNLPAREWRKRGDLAHAGRSDYSGGMKGLFDALDETWSSWMRDLDLGRARLVVPSSYLETNGAGQGATFDTDRAIFSPLSIGGQMNDMKIEQVQFRIRVAEHEATARALYQQILTSAGYADHDSSDRAIPTTATGVLDETRAKERMRDKKALHAKRAIAEQAAVALEIDGLVFPGSGGGRFERPDVEFPEISQEDPEKRSRVIQQLRAATAISIQTAVKMNDRELDDTEVAEEVSRIMSETGRTVTDPTTLGRSNPPAEALREAVARLQSN
jgi:hypothetical protein